MPAEKNLLEYALYVAFFPQMVAGPIERPYELSAPVSSRAQGHLEGVRAGLVQALWGLFKKMVLADNVADFVKLIYDTPRHYDGAACCWPRCCFPSRFTAIFPATPILLWAWHG